MSTTNERPSTIGEIIANPASIGAAIGKATTDAFTRLPTNLTARALKAAVPGVKGNPLLQGRQPLISSVPDKPVIGVLQSLFSTRPLIQRSTGSSWLPFSTRPLIQRSTGSSWLPSFGLTRSSNIPLNATSAYWIRVAYYFTLYTLLVFLLLVIVHYTITPIFSFHPGSPGVIPVPGVTNDLVYWKDKQQPPFSDPVPKKDDKLYGISYVKMFSFGIDLYVRELSTTNAYTRLILYKASAPVSGEDISGPPKIDATFTGDSFINYMKKRSSMIMYLTDTNDLIITFFSGLNQYNTAPIKNIPLYTPFRITLVVEDKMFTIYLNSKQVFQRLVPELITTPSNGNSGMQLFYSSPEWSNNPRHSIYVQNFHLWSRPITYKEVISARPALALAKDFGLSPDAGTPCASDSSSIVAASKAVAKSVTSFLN